MSDAFIGEIRLMSFDYAPKDWSQCNGQLIPVTQNQALFALLGTTYGGDGTNNFALPELRGRAIMHPSPGYYRGQRGGYEYAYMTADMVGTHSHEFHCTNNAANSHKPKSRYFANANAQVYTTQLSSLVNLNGQSMTPEGGGAPHPNMQPSLVMNYCIALYGTWPQRD